MREIKFRAWYGEKIGMLPPQFNGDINEIFAAQNGVYMQYTGLKDKDGKEIYEGDIIEEGDIITEIVFKDLAWKEKLIYSPHNHLNSYFPLSQNTTRISLFGKVIGNIYENPELLEDK